MTQSCFYHKKQLVTSFEGGLEGRIPCLTMGLWSVCEISQILCFVPKKLRRGPNFLKIS